MRLATLVFLMLVSFIVQATDEIMTAQGVLDCAVDNNPEKTFANKLHFTTIDVEGRERVLEARLLGERSGQGVNLNLRVITPPSVADTTLLFRDRKGQDDMRIYLPATGRAQRVTGGMAATKLLGTDFSYQDLKQMFGALLDGEVSYVDVYDYKGRQTDRVKLIPAEAEVAFYQEVLVAFDRATCVVLEAQFKGADGDIVRHLEADIESLTAAGERNFARIYKMSDLVNQSHTRVEFRDVALDERIPGAAFHPISFKNLD